MALGPFMGLVWKHLHSMIGLNIVNMILRTCPNTPDCAHAHKRTNLYTLQPDHDRKCVEAMPNDLFWSYLKFFNFKLFNSHVSLYFCII